MNAKAYFAAHAPTEIPEWFICKPSTPKPEPPTIDLSNDTDNTLHNLAVDWKRDPCYDLSEIDNKNITDADRAILRNYQNQWELYWGALNIWRDNRAQEVYFAWRWYYAERMCEAVKPEGKTVKSHLQQRAFNQVLAALRFWQETFPRQTIPNPSRWAEYFADEGYKPMDKIEIDHLCENLDIIYDPPEGK